MATQTRRRQTYFRPVLYAIGGVSSLTSLLMLPPLLIDFGMDTHVKFSLAFAVSLFFGILLRTVTRVNEPSLGVRQTFLLTSGAWIAVGLFGALPFVVGANALSLTDAIFESVSAITTTGATVITDLEATSPGLLLWRAEMQWIGGIGIIVLGIAIMPALNVGGLQLFRTESSDRLDKALPRVADISINIGWIYVGMTCLTCVALFALAGLSFFDALCHALTSVSTAGFSTRTASVGAFDNPTAEIILIFAMIAGVLPFSRYIAATRGDWGVFVHDRQIRIFLLWLLVAVGGMCLWRLTTLDASAEPVWRTVREVVFNTVSIVTTTGYSSADYSAWGPFAMFAFFCFMWVGGCIGSTTGGLKIFRIQILFTAVRLQLISLIAPWRVQMPEYAGQSLSERAMLAATGYIALTFLFFLAVTLVLTAMQIDVITAMSASASALMNVGPGLGETIGPVGSYAPLPNSAKWVLIVAMLLGRLEFFTALVMLSPGFWRG